MTNIITLEINQSTILAVDMPDCVAIPINPICASIGLNQGQQRKMILADPILSKGVVSISLPSVGGMQEMVCLRLDLVHGWLFKINPNRVSVAARPRLIAFQIEGYRKLFEYFYSRREDLRAPPAASMSDEMKQRWIGLALRCGGARAGTQMWLAVGGTPLPALVEAQRQRELFGPKEPDADGHFVPTSVN